MDMARFVYITVVISASLGLGFIFGKAYMKRKMKKLTRRVQVLENFKHAVKVLCPKIKDGEDMNKLPSDFPTISRTKDDEDTKTGELAIVTEGHPKDA